MLSRTRNFMFNPNYNFAVTGVFVQPNTEFKQPLPPLATFRITDAGENRIVDSGEFRITDN